MAEVALASSFARLSLSLPNSLSSFSGLRIESTKLQSSTSISLVKHNRAASTMPSLPRITANSAIIEEREALEKFVKSAMPGGLAAQKLLATGRRKTAVARVVLVEGTGKIIINCRTAQDYLQGNPLWLQYVKFPLVSLGYETKYDVIVKAEGGGLAGQAQAILLGIARALCVANPANRDPLKKQGLLTRDPRSVERKKAGLHKARKAPQYSKR